MLNKQKTDKHEESKKILAVYDNLRLAIPGTKVDSIAKSDNVRLESALHYSLAMTAPDARAVVATRKVRPW